MLIRFALWSGILTATMAVVAVAAAEHSPGAATPVSAGEAAISGSQTWIIRSAVNHVDYKLFVFLPRGYAESTSHYPVFYLTDGNTGWPAAYEVLERLIGSGEMAPVILVGIGYRGGSERLSDYATVADSYWSVPKDRGAPVFLKAVKDEIIPFIEKTYRADPARRGLGGHSLGGYFTLFTFITSPETFQRYWISSPSLPWDKGVIFHLEQAYGRTREDVHARVYADMGALEPLNIVDDLLKMENQVAAHRYPGLAWKTDIEPGLTHGGIPTAVFGRAMAYLYGRADIPLPLERRQQLQGEYKLPDGTTFRVVNEGAVLYLTGWRSTALALQPEVRKIRLLADSPNSFYVPYVNLNFTVSPGETDAPQKLLVSQPPVSEVRHVTTINATGELVANRVH